MPVLHLDSAPCAPAPSASLIVGNDPAPAPPPVALLTEPERDARARRDACLSILDEVRARVESGEVLGLTVFIDHQTGVSQIGSFAKDGWRTVGMLESLKLSLLAAMDRD